MVKITLFVPNLLVFWRQFFLIQVIEGLHQVDSRPTVTRSPHFVTLSAVFVMLYALKY